jgi:hypothetical protein
MNNFIRSPYMLAWMSMVGLRLRHYAMGLETSGAYGENSRSKGRFARVLHA